MKIDLYSNAAFPMFSRTRREIVKNNDTIEIEGHSVKIKPMSPLYVFIVKYWLLALPTSLFLKMPSTSDQPLMFAFVVGIVLALSGVWKVWIQAVLSFLVYAFLLYGYIATQGDIRYGYAIGYLTEYMLFFSTWIRVAIDVQKGEFYQWYSLKNHYFTYARIEQ